MAYFSKWQDLNLIKEEALSWYNNKDKIDFISRCKYDVIVRLGMGSIQYCGQSHSNAQKYHEMPQSFVKYITKSVEKNIDLLISDALKLLENDEIAELIKAKGEVCTILAKITVAEQQNQCSLSEVATNKEVKL